MEKGERLVALRDAGADLAALVPLRREKAVRQNAPLLSIRNLRKTYTTKSGGWIAGKGERIVAVDDVSFDIRRGECLGLVGESGCGKTSLSKLIMRAIKPDRGTITFNDGADEIDVLAL